WPDWKIVFELGRKMGFKKEFPWAEVEEAIDFQLEPTGLSVDLLGKHPDGVVYEEIRYEKYKTGGFHTPTGKVELFSERFREQGYPPLPEFSGLADNPMSFSDQGDDFPFIGISGARSKAFVHSQYRNIPSLLKYDPEPFVDIHPGDAERLGICDGERVKIESPNGSIRIPQWIHQNAREDLRRGPSRFSTHCLGLGRTGSGIQHQQFDRRLPV
ncbi:MAG: molybdopterin-dependent oxidoreductase, partial [Deltaproteobacteria bacterium]|nr:molybdopterin-dependent oxidoreductase [Deltaproteobacteria bacterium]